MTMEENLVYMASALLVPFGAYAGLLLTDKIYCTLIREEN